VKSITLAIPEHAAEKLAELARRQYRAPRQQAVVLLLEALERTVATPPEVVDRGRRERSSR
jgi:hypothetical protein